MRPGVSAETCIHHEAQQHTHALERTLENLTRSFCPVACLPLTSHLLIADAYWRCEYDIQSPELDDTMHSTSCTTASDFVFNAQGASSWLGA